MGSFTVADTIIERLLRGKQSSGRRKNAEAQASPHRPSVRPGPAREEGARPICTRKGGLISEGNNIQALICAQVPERLGDMEPGGQTPGMHWAGALVVLGANGRPPSSWEMGSRNRAPIALSRPAPPAGQRPRGEARRRARRRVCLGDLGRPPRIQEAK